MYQFYENIRYAFGNKDGRGLCLITLSQRGDSHYGWQVAHLCFGYIFLINRGVEFSARCACNGNRELSRSMAGIILEPNSY